MRYLNYEAIINQITIFLIILYLFCLPAYFLGLFKRNIMGHEFKHSVIICLIITISWLALIISFYYRFVN